MSNNDISKFISLILRHKPEVIGIQLDAHGWADVKELIMGIRCNYPRFDMDTLDTIVKTDSKKRYSFNIDKTKIRANQGHSIKIDLELQPIKPPNILYHGTAIKYISSIDCEGLISKSRQYVHLSADIETARNVGIRHGQPVIYEVKSGMMYDANYKFYVSENGIWLTEFVPSRYLRKIV